MADKQEKMLTFLVPNVQMSLFSAFFQIAIFQKKTSPWWRGVWNSEVLNAIDVSVN